MLKIKIMKKKSIKKKREKMTIDKLAELTQKGFEALGFDTENKINGLRDELKDEMSEKFDMVLTGQDQILKRLENLETDNTMDAVAHRRHEGKLENHEKRIVVVENKVLVQ
jgi:hypothetical protein